jgi:hypothetical protein
VLTFTSVRPITFNATQSTKEIFGFGKVYSVYVSAPACKDNTLITFALALDEST